MFQDTPDRSHWASLPIGWAYDEGATGGIGAETFGFGTNVSREEVVLFLCRTVAPDTCQPSQDPLPSSVVPGSTATPTPNFVDVPTTVNVDQYSVDGWSCRMHGYSIPYSVNCNGKANNMPRFPPSAVELSVGTRMGCLVRGYYTHYDFDWQPHGYGPLTCWGTGMPSDLDLDPGSLFIDVAVGSQLGNDIHQVCAIRHNPESMGIPSGQLECWGPITVEQVTYGSTRYQVSDFDWVDVTVGRNHVCAVQEGEFDGGGYVECWGDNTYGQLEDPIGMFDEVRSRYDVNWSCALDLYNGDWECWGADNPVAKP